jgi:hypothetical protein
MKYFNILFLCLVATSFISLHAQISLTINNAGFESGTGVNTTRNFNATDNWFNRGTDGTAEIARRLEDTTGLLASGDYVGQITDRYNVLTATSDFDSAAFGDSVHSNKTSYTISSGDYFEIGYVWMDQYRWNDQLDEVRFVLFATDTDTLGGNVAWSSVMDSGIRQTDGEYESVSDTSTIVSSEAVGQTLFLNIFGFQNDGAMSGNTGYARIDDITVSVVPEPSTFTLIAGLIALCSRLVSRRKV